MTQSKQNRKINLLIVEDDEDHVVLIRAAMGNYRDLFDVTVCDNGLNALQKVQEHITEGLRFDLILLDINTPVIDGFDFLKKIRMEEQLCFTPVVVLTTTNSTPLLQKAYVLGANTVLSKDVFFSPQSKIADTFFDYWTNLAFLPRGRICAETV